MLCFLFKKNIQKLFKYCFSLTCNYSVILTNRDASIYHLFITKEKILRLHQTKQSLADSLLEGTNMSHKLTTQDIMELLG